ncbi:MAG: efflux RND transporter periplasmic adaptor subunit [Planctomycetota bacterium]|jgi:Cu(I)/Ag(I) efflux system membrane fusion protein
MKKLPPIPPFLRKPGALLLPVLLIAVFLAGWWIGRPAEADSPGAPATAGGTVWTCSMHPTVRQPGPGQCPICGMDLIKVSASGPGGLRDLTLTPDAVARLDIRVTPAVRKAATNRLRFLGRVAPDETRVATTTARMDGRLDRLFVDYTGITVRKGDHLAEIYSPDLYIAQEELIQAKRNLGSSRQAFYAAAREKLRLLGIHPEQIDEIEKREKPSDHITLNAPQDGIVLTLHKREGDYVKEGEALYSLADLSRVWVFLEAYEDDLAWLRFTQEVVFHADALPGRTFAGRIAFIDPILDETRRIARVRVNVDNPEGALKPGMFIRGRVKSVLAGDRVMNPELAGKWISPMHPEIIKDTPGTCDICGMALVRAEELGFITDGEPSELPLLIPASAVLRTGDRAVVYRRISSRDGITFEGREVVLGPRAGDHFVVESGLREGDLVVTRGAFKLDSELQIQARTAMMLDGQPNGEASAIEAPATIRGAWTPVLRSLARAKRDRHAPERFEEHLARAGRITGGIAPKFLPDAYAPLWREASMRLENLFAAARRDARTRSTAEAWENLVRDLPGAAAIAGLDWQIPAAEPLPGARLEEVRATVEAYLPVANLLAHDKAVEAVAAGPALAAALRAVSLPGIPEAADGVAAASDAASMRTALKEVTDALHPVIREGGDDRLGKLYLVHCPMAFDHKGADWLAREPKVENPYFGSDMFSCGDVTETLSLPADFASEMPMKDGGDHSGHKR